MKLPIETLNPLFGKYLYPEANAIRIKQQDITWTAEEIAVAKDIPDYKVNMSPQQFNLVSTTLQTFVEIEQKVGDVWAEIASWFPHSEIEGACIEIARMEKAVHAFFYQKMSDVLNIDPEETAKKQKEIKQLKGKLDLLTKVTSNLSENKPLALATVALIEQVLLFSNFAMLKSFQANGHNLIPNTITGVEFVTNDETIHGEFASYLFKTVLSEDTTNYYNRETLRTNILAIANEIVRHESEIIDYSYAGATVINDITTTQLKHFIMSRANSVMEMLGYDPIYTIEDNPIAAWFYKETKGIQMHDFFASNTSQYRRSWDLEGFSRLPFIGDKNE